MKTCEEHDGVLVYEGRKCPVCATIADMDVQQCILQENVDGLAAEVARLQSQLDELENLFPAEASVVRLRGDGR